MKLTRTFQPRFGILHFSPLLDVILILLLFFILSSSFVLQPGIAVTAPISDFMMAPRMNAEIVSITGAPVARIFFRDEQMGVEDLDKHLSARPAVDERTIIIKADQSTPYDLVVAVSNTCLRHGYSVVLATSQRL